MTRLSAAAWEAWADWARTRAAQAQIAADITAERVVHDGDPWRPGLLASLAAAERLKADAYREYAAQAAAVATQARAEELAGALGGLLPNTVEIAGRTLAQDVQRRGEVA